MTSLAIDETPVPVQDVRVTSKVLQLALRDGRTGPHKSGARAGGRRLSAHAEAVTAIVSRRRNPRTIWLHGQFGDGR
jgi:hypothetical protein